MAKILIADKLSEQSVRIFQDNGLVVDFKPGLSPEEQLKIIHEYDGLAIRSATKVTSELLEKAVNLKVVGRAGIGVDNVDLAAATQKGVVVMNTPFGNATTTAEHTISMMMALARQIPMANASTHQGLWEKNRFMGVELDGKTLGLIGCGNIGSIVASKAIGLGLKVMVYDPFFSDERAKEMHVTCGNFEEVLQLADIISVHTPLTDKTRNLFNKNTLKKCRKGVMIINCARGGIINEQDLADMLDQGHVKGAALDVFEQEPAKSNILFGRDDVICTPHLGAATLEAQENVAVQVAQQMVDYFKTGAINNALNMPSLSAGEAKQLEPYMKLCDLLGSFCGQLSRAGDLGSNEQVKKIEIDYCGKASSLNKKPLTQQAIASFLKPDFDHVNMVNAPALLGERQVNIVEKSSTECNGYENLIRIRIITSEKSRAICGTVFEPNRHRIVEIKDIAIEGELKGHMLYVTNHDRPGFIGRLGTVLSDHKINISTFHLGRRAQENDAIALVGLDQDISEAVMAEITAIENVIRVKKLHFD